VPTVDWSSSLAPWNSTIEPLRRHFGETWVAYVQSAIAAGITSQSERGKGADRLFDDGVTLCERARYARLRRGGSRWWTDQVGEADTALAKSFWLLMVLGWAPAPAVEAAQEQIELLLSDLDDQEYLALVRGLQLLRLINNPSGRRLKRSLAAPGDRLGYLEAVLGAPWTEELLTQLEKSDTSYLRTMAKRQRLQATIADAGSRTPDMAVG